MRETKIERTARFFNKMSELGFSYSEAQSLRRIEMTLQRWGEKECGDGNDRCSWAIERDEETDKPYLVVDYHPYTIGDTKVPGRTTRRPIPDLEKGALARIAKIMAKHPGLWAYHQTDCRGCQLYIGKRADMTAQELERIDSLYTRGFAVCI